MTIALLHFFTVIISSWFFCSSGWYDEQTAYTQV